jgi:arylsulfatase A-like enzyme
MRTPWLLLLLVACGGGSDGPTSTGQAAHGVVRRDAPTAIVVLVDGLRRDHLACYGYGLDPAPNLSALAAEATVFDDPVAVTTGANGGLATLLTGQSPVQHGVGSLRHRGQHRLADGRETLA